MDRVYTNVVRKFQDADFGFLHVDYLLFEPTVAFDITFTEKDDELTLVKVRSAIDYLYYTSIKTLLEDYLQMEQLRFGFKYEINHSEDVDLENIEIPSMLLQPFVENAVKHGISQKATDGEIMIAFFKQANDLVLTVTDNGNGFDTGKKNNGLGLQLSDSRIALLNSMYKENRFILAIQSTNNGTEISLTLTDWL